MYQRRGEWQSEQMHRLGSAPFDWRVMVGAGSDRTDHSRWHRRANARCVPRDERSTRRSDGAVRHRRQPLPSRRPGRSALSTTMSLGWTPATSALPGPAPATAWAEPHSVRSVLRVERHRQRRSLGAGEPCVARWQAVTFHVERRPPCSPLAWWAGQPCRDPSKCPRARREDGALIQCAVRACWDHSVPTGRRPRGRFTAPRPSVRASRSHRYGSMQAEGAIGGSNCSDSTTSRPTAASRLDHPSGSITSSDEAVPSDRRRLPASTRPCSRASAT